MRQLLTSNTIVKHCSKDTLRWCCLEHRATTHCGHTVDLHICFLWSSIFFGMYVQVVVLQAFFSPFFNILKATYYRVRTKMVYFCVAFYFWFFKAMTEWCLNASLTNKDWICEWEGKNVLTAVTTVESLLRWKWVRIVAKRLQMVYCLV